MPLRVVHGSSQDVSARHRSFGADALDRPDQTTGTGDTGADLPPVADSPSAWSAQNEERIEAHNFVNFIAYCLHVTLKNLARPRAPGLTPRAVLEKFATMQMVDVHLPTTDGRHLVLPRRTDPTRDQQLLLHQLDLKLPEQPPPRISTWPGSRDSSPSAPCSADLSHPSTLNQ